MATSTSALFHLKLLEHFRLDYATCEIDYPSEVRDKTAEAHRHLAAVFLKDSVGFCIEAFPQREEVYLRLSPANEERVADMKDAILIHTAPDTFTEDDIFDTYEKINPIPLEGEVAISCKDHVELFLKELGATIGPSQAVTTTERVLYESAKEEDPEACRRIQLEKGRMMAAGRGPYKSDEEKSLSLFAETKEGSCEYEFFNALQEYFSGYTEGHLGVVKASEAPVQAHSPSLFLETPAGFQFLSVHCRPEFKDIKEIASGPFGIVYEVELLNQDQHEDQGRTTYALKKIAADVSMDFEWDAERLHQAFHKIIWNWSEALFLPKLSHPHIVQYKSAWIERVDCHQFRSGIAWDNEDSYEPATKVS